MIDCVRSRCSPVSWLSVFILLQALSGPLSGQGAIAVVRALCARCAVSHPECIVQLSAHYELVVFTASVRRYADAVTKSLHCRWTPMRLTSMSLCALIAGD